MKTVQIRADLFTNNVKELRAIATSVLNMVSGNKSDDALGAVYNSIIQLSCKLKDEAIDGPSDTRKNGE
tara:strand:- start:270 stop:476 length:207 start_codon:yes stop_codon:yes gene_type:complete